MIFPVQKHHHRSIEEIFWETSSRQQFKDPSEKERFKKKYLDDYLTNSSALNFCLVREDRVLGYIISIKNISVEISLLDSVPYLHQFREHFKRYPAHLHINLSPSVQGKGFGSQLLTHLEASLFRQGIEGVHLFTLPQARNVSFYSKNAYNKISEQSGILMLGKPLC